MTTIVAFSPHWIARFPLRWAAALFCLAGLTAFSSATEPPAAAPSRRPNIVFLLADDLGWADVGCYGSTFHETPNIDHLARDGMKFTTFYGAGSVCSPSRASIMTGKYPPRTGITDWIPGLNVPSARLRTQPTARHLALEEFTVGEAFKAGGYQTFYVGKWHLGDEGFRPTEQGFDWFVGEEPGVGEEAEAGRDLDNAERLRRRRNSTERYTRASLEFLQQRDTAKPFLLFLSYNDVHIPIQPMPGLVEPYAERAKRFSAGPLLADEHEGKTRMRQDNAPYASMVAAVDESVGRICRRLGELGLADNTLVVFTSDNGGLSTNRTGGPACNVPLRAGKGWLYEGGIRVPLVIRWPNRIKSGATSPAPLITNDFYPTLLDLAGLPPRPEQHLDGVSFAPLLRGSAAPAARTLYWHYPHYHGSTWKPGAALRDGDWKLIEFYESGAAELYNLRDDPAEAEDLAGTDPGRVRELLAKLHAWQKSVGAHVPQPK